MHRIIINADDFGINNIVTEEIIKMIKEKKISSTTIMANGTCLDLVSDFALNHPEISYGIHFCLSEFSSLTSSPVLYRYGLIDKDGFFIKKAILKLKRLDNTLKSALKDELMFQLLKVKNLGIPISHADSHHHVHTLPLLKEVFNEVLKESKINKIRLCYEYTTWRENLHVFSKYKRWRYNKVLKSQYDTTDKFYSYNSFCLLKQTSISSNDIIELMCHPGHPGEIYMQEMELVSSSYLKTLMDYKLISYNEL